MKHHKGTCRRFCAGRLQFADGNNFTSSSIGNCVLMLAIFGSYFVLPGIDNALSKNSMMTLIDTGKGQLIRSLFLQGGLCRIQVHRFAEIFKKTKPHKPCFIKCNGGDHWPVRVMCWNYLKACRLVSWKKWIKTSSWRPRGLRQVVKLCHTWRILHVH